MLTSEIHIIDIGKQPQLTKILAINWKRFHDYVFLFFDFASFGKEEGRKNRKPNQELLVPLGSHTRAIAGWWEQGNHWCIKGANFDQSRIEACVCALERKRCQRRRFLWHFANRLRAAAPRLGTLVPDMLKGRGVNAWKNKQKLYAHEITKMSIVIPL